MIDLEAHLRHRRDVEGRKLFVPYVSGGLDDEWVDLVRAFADAGADAIEIGIPFSDPVMDGPVIQEASDRALALGATPPGLLTEAATLGTAGASSLPPPQATRRVDSARLAARAEAVFFTTAITELNGSRDVTGVS